MTLSSIRTSSTVAVGSNRKDEITSRYDRDWHRVYLQAGNTYQFGVNRNWNANYGYSGDPTLYLRNQGGSYLSFDDDSGNGLSSQINHTANYTGYHYLDVGNLSSSQYGRMTYTVSATLTNPGPVYPTSSPWYPTSPVTQETTSTTDNSTDNSVDNSVDNSQVDNSSTVNNTTTNNVDNSISNTVTQNFTITITGDNNSLGSFGNTTFQQSGTQGADILTGNSSEAASDVFRGMDGDDQLTGFRGADVLVGDAGNDIIRGGNGRDVLTGGAGADQIYGGFGQNTFTGELDGAVDRLYLQSDQWSYNWVYESAGNQDGNKVDVIGALDTFDRITIQGVSDGLLTYGSTTTTIQGQQVSGIGIFAAGTLEAVYTGNNLSASQLDAMTTGSMLSL